MVKAERTAGKTKTLGKPGRKVDFPGLSASFSAGEISLELEDRIKPKPLIKRFHFNRCIYTYFVPVIDNRMMAR